MTDSPIVQAVRKSRAQLAKDNDYDLGRLIAAIREAEKESARTFVDPHELRGGGRLKASGNVVAPGLDSPVVQRVREARRKLCEEYDNDIGKLLDAVRESARKSGRRQVDLRALRERRRKAAARRRLLSCPEK